MQSMYCTDCDISLILYLVEPVFVPEVGVCQNLVKLRMIFPSNPIKPKSHYLEIYSDKSKASNSFPSWTTVIPFKFSWIIKFRWCSKAWRPGGYAPDTFSRVPEEFNTDVGPLKWESRLLIFYFCTNIVTVSYICLLREFWHFLNIRSEPRPNVVSQPHRGRCENTVW